MKDDPQERGILGYHFSPVAGQETADLIEKETLKKRILLGGQVSTFCGSLFNSGHRGGQSNHHKAIHPRHTLPLDSLPDQMDRRSSK